MRDTLRIPHSDTRSSFLLLEFLTFSACISAGEQNWTGSGKGSLDERGMRASDEYLHGYGAMHDMSSATRGFHGLALMYVFVLPLLSLLASFKEAWRAY